MTGQDGAIDVGKVYVSPAVRGIRRGRLFLQKVLRCHGRFARRVAAEDNTHTKERLPTLVRSTHWCWDQNLDRQLTIDVLTLDLGQVLQTVVLMPEEERDYGGLAMSRVRFHGQSLQDG